MLRHIPNALTLFRGTVLTPLIACLFIWSALAYYEHLASPNEYFPYRSWGLILTLFAITTDVLDGYLAKTFGWKSDFGARVDPLMDKWFTYTGFFVVPLYYGMGWYLLWFVPMAVHVHLYSSETTRMRRQGDILEANESARQKTGFLFGAQIAFMTAIALEDVFEGVWLTVLVYVVFTIAFASMAWASVLCRYAITEYREQAERRQAERAMALRRRTPAIQPAV